MTDPCCPMDSYAPGADGDMAPDCTCPDDCDCMCTECLCALWGEEDDDG